MCRVKITSERAHLKSLLMLSVIYHHKAMTTIHRYVIEDADEITVYVVYVYSKLRVGAVIYVTTINEPLTFSEFGTCCWLQVPPPPLSLIIKPKKGSGSPCCRIAQE